MSSQTKPYRYKDIKSFFKPATEIEKQPINSFEFDIPTWLKRFYDILYSHDIKLITLYGTCLGLYRDGDIIEDDTDADFGIYMTDLPKLYDCITPLLDAGFYISGRGLYQISFSLPNLSFYIDIWPIQKAPFYLRLLGYRWICDHVYFKNDFFSTLSFFTLRDQQYYFPNFTETYLKKIYGPHWRIPMKNTFSGPRGFLSQCLNALFVDFSIPIAFSGDNQMGTFKPWVSYLLKRFFPEASVTRLFKHPRKT